MCICFFPPLLVELFYNLSPLLLEHVSLLPYRTTPDNISSPISLTSNVDILPTRTVCSKRMTSLQRSHRDLSNECTFCVETLLVSEISMFGVKDRWELIISGVVASHSNLRKNESSITTIQILMRNRDHWWIECFVTRSSKNRDFPHI